MLSRLLNQLATRWNQCCMTYLRTKHLGTRSGSKKTAVAAAAVCYCVSSVG